jgi:NADH-quinone oxidoreductase subunit J
VGLLAELLILLLLSPYGGRIGTATQEVILETGPSHAVGITMFSDYLLLFEIVGIFLLGAVIGAIVLAKTPVKTENQEPANFPTP